MPNTLVIAVVGWPPASQRGAERHLWHPRSKGLGGGLSTLFVRSCHPMLATVFQGSLFCVCWYLPTSAKSGIWQRLNISGEDVLPLPWCSYSVCFVFLVFLYWQIDVAKGDDGINIFLVFGTTPELCWAHRSCIVSSHRHHVPGKKTPLTC